jgi:hypothetical protein
MLEKVNTYLDTANVGCIPPEHPPQPPTSLLQALKTNSAVKIPKDFKRVIEPTSFL